MNKYKKAYYTISKELHIANIDLPLSISAFNELVERATPKKLKLNIVKLPGCPNCGSCNDYNDFCYKCGQALLQGSE